MKKILALGIITTLASNAIYIKVTLDADLSWRMVILAPAITIIYYIAMWSRIRQLMGRSTNGPEPQPRYRRHHEPRKGK